MTHGRLPDMLGAICSEHPLIMGPHLDAMDPRSGGAQPRLYGGSVQDSPLRPLASRSLCHSLSSCSLSAGTSLAVVGLTLAVAL